MSGTLRTTDGVNIDLLHLTRCRGLNHARISSLMREFHTPAAALEQLATSERVRRRYHVASVPTRGFVEDEIARLTNMGGFFLVPGRLPLLQHIEDPPTVLSAIGNRELLNGSRTIAIVGSRSVSATGLEMTRRLVRGLSSSNFTTVSGLAKGVDAHVHRLSMERGTIAVVANGLDVCYPAENKSLQDAIKERGLLLSEMPLGCPPLRRFFPRRNRIVSGLSVGTLVIEARANSGSMITARCAFDQGRRVWAVPGCPLDPLSRGTNRLIRDGAILVESAQDVLDSLGDGSGFEGAPDLGARPPCVPPEGVSRPDAGGEPELRVPGKREVLNLLGATVPHLVEDLAQQSRLSPQVLRELLLELELEGYVTRRSDGFCRSSPGSDSNSP